MRAWRGDVALYRQLPGVVRLLLLTQCVFNIGFYLVVPFLAIYFEHDLHLAGTVIGLILGLRTFSQQGMFFVGGALTDYWGVKPVLLTGIAVRVAGFLALAVSRQLWVVIAGVVMIGLAAAMFSPASESAILGLAGQLEAEGGPRRTGVLALQNVFSQAGSALGPALGGVLFFVPFQATCVVAAAIFAGVGVAHGLVLPQDLRVGERCRITDAWRYVLSNKSFVVFCLINSVMLVAYNQMYLALPVEVERAGLQANAVTWFFLLASVIVILFQSRVTARADRLGPIRAMIVGYLLTSMSFAIVAVAAWWRASTWFVAALPAVLFVVTLHAGSMAGGPPSRELVARLAHEQHLGSHMGAMATVGGIAVLVVSGPIGALLEPARQPGITAVVPWAVLAGLPLIAALALSWLQARGTFAAVCRES